MTKKYEDWETTKQKLCHGDKVRKELKTYFKEEPKIIYKNDNSKALMLIGIIFFSLILIVLITSLIVGVEQKLKPTVITSTPQRERPIIIENEIHIPKQAIAGEIKLNVESKKIAEGIMIEYDNGKKAFYQED